MRSPFLFLLLPILILQACTQFSSKPAEPESEKKSFRINDDGDTVLINYRANGTKISEITIKNGTNHGLCINYYENGNIKNEISYVNGYKNGRVTWNYENGKLYRESEYVNDELEGIQKKYYEDGKLMAEIPYLRGEVQPGTKEYTSDGTLKKIVPEIIIEPIDKMAFENKYLLRISLSKKQKDTKFTRIVEIEGSRHKVGLSVIAGIAEIPWHVAKGMYIMEKVKIEAEYFTNLGNPVKLVKTYNLAIENR